jgi:hypothetical protein
MTEIGATLEVSGKKGDSHSARQMVADLSAYLEKIEVVEGPPT